MGRAGVGALGMPSDRSVEAPLARVPAGIWDPRCVHGTRYALALGVLLRGVGWIPPSHGGEGGARVTD